MAAGWTLAVDVGTTFTAAAVAVDGRVEVVEFDHQRVMPSVVVLDENGELTAGQAAASRAAVFPERAERVPKRALVSADRIRLAGRDVPTVALITAILAEVAAEACRGRPTRMPQRLILTHPARWSGRELALLGQAATAAQLPVPEFMPEPVAAARHYLSGHQVEPGQHVAVFDLGGGTLDTAVLRRTDDGFALAGAPGGNPHLGGEDLDEVLRTVVGVHADATHPQAWQRIWTQDGQTGHRLRARWREAIRGAREELSRKPAVTVYEDGIETGVRITRAEFEQRIDAMLRSGVYELLATITRAGLQPSDLTAIHLTGGASRTPLVSDLISTLSGVLPTTTSDPKTTVALGALTLQPSTETIATRPTTTTAPTPVRQSTPPTPNTPTPKQPTLDAPPGPDPAPSPTSGTDPAETTPAGTTPRNTGTDASPARPRRRTVIVGGAATPAEAGTAANTEPTTPAANSVKLTNNRRRIFMERSITLLRLLIPIDGLIGAVLAQLSDHPLIRGATWFENDALGSLMMSTLGTMLVALLVALRVLRFRSDIVTVDGKGLTVTRWRPRAATFTIQWDTLIRITVTGRGPTSRVIAWFREDARPTDQWLVNHGGMPLWVLEGRTQASDDGACVVHGLILYQVAQTVRVDRLRDILPYYAGHLYDAGSAVECIRTSKATMIVRECRGQGYPFFMGCGSALVALAFSVNNPGLLYLSGAFAGMGALAAGLTGLVIGLTDRSDVLKLDRECITVVQWKNQKTMTFTIRWDALVRIAVEGHGDWSRVVVWFREDAQPTEEWLAKQHIEPNVDGGGFSIYEANPLSHRRVRADRLSTVLSRYAGQLHTAGNT